MAAFLDFSRPLPVPQILLLGFQENRTAFTHMVETLTDWALLGSVAGQFRYRLGNGRAGICNSGDFILCPPGVSLTRVIEKTLNFYTLRFRWKPSKPEAWCGPWTLRDGIRYQSTLTYLRACHDAVEPRALAGWAEHLLGDLLCQLAHEAQTRTASAPAAPDRLMLRAEEHMRSHMAAAIRLEDLARELRINPFQLSRRFRAAFGVSPSVYRTRLRIPTGAPVVAGNDMDDRAHQEGMRFHERLLFQPRLLARNRTGARAPSDGSTSLDGSRERSLA